jgi:hypothetical protein
VSNKQSLRFFAALLFAATACAALVLADVGPLAQNSNSSTTEDSAQNANTMAPRRGRGRRRGRTGVRKEIVVIAPVTSDAQGEENIAPGEQTDLSGTYAGRVTMTGGHEMSGEATLTITGNTFALAAEGMTHNGRVYAVTTRGYTGASFYFADITDPATNTPVVAACRARKSGDNLWLTPVPFTRTKMTFTPGGGGGGGRRGRRGRRSAGATETNSNTGDNTNTTPPM